ncbi:MAG: hypothetical protein RL641_680 [Candidatus Parcubacteria bacterium]|jgi:NADH dehydrogenase
MSPKKQHKKPSVIIVGGGFAGTALARKLADESTVNITLISDKSYFEYYPAFYRVVTGAAPIEVCVPLSDLVPKDVDIVIDRAVAVDLAKKEIKGEKGQVYTADYIVLALGSQTSYFNLPGIPEHSFGFKSIGEATELKDHIKNLFIGKVNHDASAMVSNFQIVIVGGGPSGVELAGDLTAYMRKLAKKYAVDPSFITIDIIDRGNRLIGATHPDASEAALKRLRSLGVNVFLNREVMAEDVETILIGDMDLKTKTVIWTAGTTINALYSKIEGLQMTERRRVLVDDYMEVPNFEDVYIAGDAAGTKYSGLAQTAMHDAKFVANDILRKLQKRSRRKYKVKEIEYIIPIGHNWALMSLGKIHIFGWFAYFARQTVDFLYFATILPPKKTFELFWKGKKYR